MSFQSEKCEKWHRASLIHIARISKDVYGRDVPTPLSSITNCVRANSQEVRASFEMVSGSYGEALDGPTGNRAKPPPRRRTAWLFVLTDTEMKKDEQGYIKAITEKCSELSAVRIFAQQFRRMLREHDGSAFDAWLTLADGSLLRSFVRSLRGDVAAVRAAFELPWSNGQTEGHVNRLKLIKRSMYGRGGFDLLRERVLHAV